jgi:uncharacterized membrane protein
MACLILLAAIFSLSIDAGSAYLAKERLQDAVDLAAIKAATDPANAAALAQATVSDNVGAANLTQAVAITSGRYPPTGYTLANIGTLDLASRFEPGAAQPNALRVTAQRNVPLFLTSLFFSGGVPVSAQATAYNEPLTQVTIGTGALAVDSAQMTANNTLLSGLLGSSIVIDAISYQGLIDTNVKLFGFLDLLAVATGTASGDYAALLSLNVTLTEVIDALIATVQADPDLPGVAAALTASLQTLRGQVGTVGSFNLGSILQLSENSTSKAVGAELNLYALLRASSEAINQQNDTLTTVNVPVTGGTITLRLAVVEPAQVSVVGGVGIVARSAQIRAYLEVAPIAPITVLGVPVSLRFPIYVTGLAGQATVTALDCAGPDAATANVDVTAQAGPISGSTADIDTTALHQTTPLATQPALIAYLAGLLRVTASGNTSINGSPHNLSFVAPFDSSNTQRVPLSSPFQSIAAYLVANDTFTVTALGIPFPSSVVMNQLTPILNAIVPQVDALIGDLMEAMGIAIAYMDVSVPYVRCSNPVLAQ